MPEIPETPETPENQNAPDPVPDPVPPPPTSALPNKWGQAYWVDLGERVLSTFLGALLGTFVVVEGGDVLDWSDGAAVWAILGVPTLVSLIKGLLVNLGGVEPTASVVHVTSDPGSGPGRQQIRP